MSAAPYPADTRAKGWRFEIDYEQVEQSSTWALAGPEARPWLLMMWMTAWRQVPCGSLPSDDAVIAAQIGMPAKVWAKHRAVMLRGWAEADDGRLYHPTLTARVIEMMARRRSDSDRKTRERMRKADGQPQDSQGITPESRVTPPGLPPDSSTDNRLPNTEYQIKNTHTPPPVDNYQPVDNPPAVAACGVSQTALDAFGAMRMAGIADGHAGHPDLLALVAAGASPAEFQAAAADAVGRGKGFAYAIGALKRQRINAASSLAAMHKGAMPAAAGPPALTLAAPGAAAVGQTKALLAAQAAHAASARSPEAQAARLAALARVKGVAV